MTFSLYQGGVGVYPCHTPLRPHTWYLWLIFGSSALSTKETKSDVHNDLVASAMQRNRLLEIHQYLHTCYNTQLAENNKFAKLSNYFKMLNESLATNFEFVSTQQVSIDETMVPYYGCMASL